MLNRFQLAPSQGEQSSANDSSEFFKDWKGTKQDQWFANGAFLPVGH